LPVAPHPRHPRAPALAITEQVPLDPGPHLVRHVHGQRLADVAQQPPGAFEVAVGLALQVFFRETQLLTPLSCVLLEAPWRCPVGVKPLAHVALQRALDRVHGGEELLQAPAFAITSDHQRERDDADLLRPLPQWLPALAADTAGGSGHAGAGCGGGCLNGRVHGPPTSVSNKCLPVKSACKMKALTGLPEDGRRPQGTKAPWVTRSRLKPADANRGYGQNLWGAA